MLELIRDLLIAKLMLLTAWAFVYVMLAAEPLFVWNPV